MSASNDSNKKEDASDSPDDPLVEVPNISGTNELIKKSQISTMDIRGMVVRCTSCLHQINHHDEDKCMKHFRLNVIVCKECYDFYGTSEFSQDESGNYNYCTWCGNGGKLYLCDFCPNSFCSTCVRRNFGRAEVSEMAKEGWKCYMCNPDKLKSKIEFCDLILDYSKNAKKRKEKKTASESLMNKISGPLNWTETKDWVLPAFDELDDSCKTFHKRLDKLKVIGSSQSKSLRHVIKKMEQLIACHKIELGLVIKTLSGRYLKYLEQRNEAEKRKGESASKGNTTAKVNGTADKDTNSFIDITSENENDVSKDEKDDDNYKAKMLLLESDSSVSETETSFATAESIFEGNTPNSDSKEKAEEKVIENDETGSGEKADKEVTEAAIEDSNEQEEAMETDDNNPQSAELFKNGSCDIEDTNIPTKNSSNSTKEKVKKDVAEPVVSFKTTKAKARKSFNRKLSFLDSDEAARDSSSSLSSGSEKDVLKAKKTRIKNTPKKARKEISKVKETRLVSYNDPKLKLGVEVVLEKCDDLLPDGKTTIPLPDEYLLEEIDKEIMAVCKSPSKTKEGGKESKGETLGVKKKKVSESKKPIKISGSSSSSICLSSSEDDEKVTENKQLPKSKGKVDPNFVAKEEMLMSESDESSEESSGDSGSEEVKKKKSQKKGKVKSDSSDDFQPKKKKKYDKLLNKRILSDDDSSNDNDQEKKQTERKKSSKRKHGASDDGSDDKRDSDSVHTSTSDSEEEKDKKKRKRKRIKKAAASSSENDDGDDKDNKGSQGTPAKGRKNIKKIITKKDLAVETKEAQNTEKERKKRVMDRQKLYNVITDKSPDGTQIITRKMVLEVDPTSKEEIVEIHPELCEKLKPHQVKGVRFMWECTIESLKELETGTGSGCILAHCMGLGKTLQVITFLHTCLTNEHVNKKIQTALVICPYNTILNWAREFEYWLEKIDGDILVHQLTDGKDNYSRLDILKYWQRDGGVLIASYDIFRRLATDKKIPKLTKKNREKLHELLVNPGPDIVICDEGHILKNENSAVSKACSQLATERRIVLTGTPLQNNLKEYHCMLSFVKPHLLGTSKEFRNRFVNPIMNGQYDDSNSYDVKRMKKRIHILHKLLDGCVQRCDYSALTKFLPPKHEFVISVKCSEVQIKMYQYYLDNLSQHKADSKIKGGTLFADYNVLRNLCTHPYIVHTSYERCEERRAANMDTSEEEAEDDFINDGSEESVKSGSGSGSGSESQEEVVKTYKTRSRIQEMGSEEEEEEPAEAPKEKRWYNQFISDEDRHRLELSGKMVLLIDILKECEAIGDKVILFSQSLLTLDIIEDILSNLDEQEVTEEDRKRDVYCRWTKGLDYFRMDGTTSADFRKKFIDMFNSPSNDRARLFLVSTKAGGLGTNLVGANRVVMLDASWNPSHDVQAIFRVYRFGQKKPVYIYRLLAQGTMEEKIYDRQVTKLSLSIRVVDEQQIDRHFNASELAELYNFTPESLPNRPTPMVPKDTLLAEMLIKHSDWIVTYHEHDSLLQNETEEDLTEEERQAAWNEYENEREGRSTYDDNVDDEITAYSKEPDFNQADYVGSIIPSSKAMIEGIISNLKNKFPNSSASDLRKKLLMSIYTLRNIFQEKHVKILRMKQEYVAKGSVPSTVNKYLQELNNVLAELGKHAENIQKMVQADHNAQVQAMQAQAQARMASQFAQGRPANMPTQMPYAGVRIPKGAANFPAFISMQSNLQSRMAQFPGGMNPGLSNFRQAGDQRWNTAANINTAARGFAQTSAPPPNTYTEIPRQPVITEVDKEEGSNNAPEYTNSTTSSVVIEEMD